MKMFGYPSCSFVGPMTLSLILLLLATTSSSEADDISCLGDFRSSSSCEKPATSFGTIVGVNFVAGFTGCCFSITILYIIQRCFFPANSKVEEVLVLSSHGKIVPVCLFRKPMVELKLVDLMAATKDFHMDDIVVAGSSNLATTHKAVLTDGSTLTIKRLHHCILTEQQFQVEIEWIGRIRHPNLAPLLGFCIAEERLLVYKHIENGVLSSKLQSRDENLSWPMRLRIALGVARGLAWLHHGFQVPLLHQNFSSNAVLLDEDYEPRITDFGLAILNTCPPVCFSTKDDVYEFGVVMLELATGKSQGFIKDFADWRIWLSITGQIHKAIDESLRGKGNDDEIVEFLKVACECVVARPLERPSMYEIYRSLKKIRAGDEFSKECDTEFPVAFGEELDATELVKLAYRIYSGKNPWAAF